jgi:hypothetical protein
MKDYNFEWTEECQKEFDDIKDALISAPILAHPNYDLPFKLTTDACALGFGAVLSQDFPEGERVIAYSSHSTNKAEKNYSPTELEARALVWAIEKFRPYLLDKEFTLVTDHKALKAFNKISEGNHKLVRWSLKIQDVKYNVVYKPGPQIPHVDCLSRNPILAIR